MNHLAMWNVLIMKKIFLLSTGMTLAILLIGCGSQKMPDGMPKLYPLTLNVTQEGKPLPEATVSLFSIDGVNTWNSGGMTKTDGTLVVFTRGKYAGVPAGKYKVTVDCVMSDVPRPKEATMEEIMEHGKKHPEYRVVPLPYTDRKTTSLEIEVAKGTNRLNIDIPETVKIKFDSPPP